MDACRKGAHRPRRSAQRQGISPPRRQ
jgi:hypothetical protein